MSRQRDWQKKQRALGNCTQCGNDASGKKHCPDCAKKHSALMRAYYARHRKQIMAAKRRRKENGLCIWCGARRDGGSGTYCAEHAERMRGYSRANYQKQKGTDSR